MTLAQLVGRLGLNEVARRAGVRPSTIEKWLRHGASAKGADILDGIIKRHLAGLKAAESRKRNKEFQETVQTPPGSELPEEDVKPKKPPPHGEPPGESSYDTDRYRGSIHTFTIGQPLLEVDVTGLSEQAIVTWEESKRTFCMCRFLLFRFIPFNPLYKGEMVRKQGKWMDFWTSTPAQSIESAIRQDILNSLEKAQTAAESRVIWLEQMQVIVFDDKEDRPSIAAIVSKELTTT